MNSYQRNPLLESSGILKILPTKARDGVAGYLKKIRKGSIVDPVMLASVASPIPGTVAIGNAYTKSVDPYVRARAYRLVMDRPDKALVKGIVGVPKAITKTVINLPKATAETIDDAGYKLTKFGLKHGIDFNKLAADAAVGF